MQATTWTSANAVRNISYEDSSSVAGVIEGTIYWEPPVETELSGQTIDGYTVYIANDKIGNYGAQLWDATLQVPEIPFGTNHLTIWRPGSQLNRLYNTNYPASWLLVHCRHPSLGQQSSSTSATFPIYDLSSNVPEASIISTLEFQDDDARDGMVGGTVRWTLGAHADLGYTTQFLVYFAADALGGGKVQIGEATRGTNEISVQHGTNLVWQTHVLVYPKNPNGPAVEARVVEIEDLGPTTTATSSTTTTTTTAAAAGDQATTTTTHPGDPTLITGLTFTDGDPEALGIGGSLVSWTPPLNVTNVDRYLVYIAYDTLGTAKAQLWDEQWVDGEKLLMNHVPVGTNQLSVASNTERRTLDSDLPANWLLAFTWSPSGQMQPVADAAKLVLYDQGGSLPQKVALIIDESSLVRTGVDDLSGQVTWSPALQADLGYTAQWSLYLSHDPEGADEVFLGTVPVDPMKFQIPSGQGWGCGSGIYLGIYARNEHGRASSGEWVSLNACTTTTTSSSTSSTHTTSTSTSTSLSWTSSTSTTWTWTKKTSTTSTHTTFTTRTLSTTSTSMTTITQSTSSATTMTMTGTTTGTSTRTHTTSTATTSSKTTTSGTTTVTSVTSMTLSSTTATTRTHSTSSSTTTTTSDSSSSLTSTSTSTATSTSTSTSIPMSTVSSVSISTSTATSPVTSTASSTWTTVTVTGTTRSMTWTSTLSSTTISNPGPDLTPSPSPSSSPSTSPFTTSAQGAMQTNTATTTGTDVTPAGNPDNTGDTGIGSGSGSSGSSTTATPTLTMTETMMTTTTTMTTPSTSFSGTSTAATATTTTRTTTTTTTAEGAVPVPAVTVTVTVTATTSSSSGSSGSSSSSSSSTTTTTTNTDILTNVAPVPSVSTTTAALIVGTEATLTTTTTKTKTTTRAAAATATETAVTTSSSSSTTGTGTGSGMTTTATRTAATANTPPLPENTSTAGTSTSTSKNTGTSTSTSTSIATAATTTATTTTATTGTITTITTITAIIAEDATTTTRTTTTMTGTITPASANTNATRDTATATTSTNTTTTIATTASVTPTTAAVWATSQLTTTTTMTMTLTITTMTLTTTTATNAETTAVTAGGNTSTTTATVGEATGTADNTVQLTTTGKSSTTTASQTGSKSEGALFHCQPFATGCEGHVADGEDCQPHCTGGKVPLNNLTCILDLDGVGHLPGPPIDCVTPVGNGDLGQELHLWGLLRMWIETLGATVTQGDFRQAVAAALGVTGVTIWFTRAAELRTWNGSRLLAEAGSGSDFFLLNGTYEDLRLFELEYMLQAPAAGLGAKQLRLRAEAIPVDGTREQELFIEALRLSRQVEVITFKELLKLPLLLPHLVSVSNQGATMPPIPTSSNVTAAASALAALAALLLCACCGFFACRKWRPSRRRRGTDESTNEKGFTIVLPTHGEAEGHKRDALEAPSAQDAAVPAALSGGWWYTDSGKHVRFSSGVDYEPDGGVDPGKIELLNRSPLPTSSVGSPATTGELGDDDSGLQGKAMMDANSFWSLDDETSGLGAQRAWSSPKPDAMAVEDWLKSPGGSPVAKCCSLENGLDLQLGEDGQRQDARHSRLQENLAQSVLFNCPSSPQISAELGKVRSDGATGTPEQPSSASDLTAISRDSRVRVKCPDMPVEDPPSVRSGLNMVVDDRPPRPGSPVREGVFSL